MTYLDWVTHHTPTQWWHDSADPSELALGLERGAVGVTSNPVLIRATLKNSRDQWRPLIAHTLARQLPAEQQAEALVERVVTRAAERLMPFFETTNRERGWVCAQVNPARAGDRTCMFAMARRFHAWAPNVAVKLPATSAGLDVLEDCVAEGVTVTATVSFTVSQVLSIAERHRAGIARAKARGIEPGRCFAVLMIGRLDDYLRESAHDQGPQGSVTESDVRQAGLAVAKRAYALYRERHYDAVLLVAALRGSYHMTELAGARLAMSIHPAYQSALVSEDLPREERIDEPIASEVIERLTQLPDFVRAYKPDGMAASEFISYGLTQRTLSQFIEVGWKELEHLTLGTVAESTL